MWFFNLLAALLGYAVFGTVEGVLGATFVAHLLGKTQLLSVHRYRKAELKAQLAERVLQSKFLAMQPGGDASDASISAGYELWSDPPILADARAKLRRAAISDPSGWERYARIVRRHYAPEIRVKALRNLTIMSAHADDHVGRDVQVNLLALARIWKVGPQTFKGIMDECHVRLQPELARQIAA